MVDLNKSWFRYLPVTPDARRWGLYVLDAGYTLIPSGMPYPPQKHPEDHLFSWENGRTLDSFTLVYITRGKGIFESSMGGVIEINEGDLFILFPNEWHRYRPDPAVGWDEYWVEFDGDQARRIMNHPGFSKRQPVVCLGCDEKMLSLFMEIIENIERESSEFEHIIAAQTSHIVARLLASIRRTDPNPARAELVRRACCIILEQSNQCIDFNQLARQLGLSLSGFRKQFRKVTGVPPGQYQQQIRINKACELLRQTVLPIGEIATRLGFESIFYFSRIFKHKTGLSPSDYRKRSLLRG